MKTNKRKSNSGDVSSSQQKVLTETYFTVKNPGSFGGKKKLKRSVKKISIDKINNWLSSKDAYTLHRPAIKTFKRRKFVVSGIDSTFQADLTDLVQFTQENDGNRYILFCVDVFSKYAWARPLKTKSGKDMVAAFQSIFDHDNRICRYLHTDKGKEFFNKEFQAFLAKYGIKLYSTENQETKASIVERLQKTIKSSMFRYFTYTGTYRWVDVLQDIISSYNNSFHSSLNMRPSDVNYRNQENVWQHLYNDRLMRAESATARFRFNEGDTVRISKYSTVFKKGYLPLWSDEIFVVADRHHTIPPVYSLKDQAGDDLKGTWYEKELQKVKSDNIYRIEAILGKRKVRGKIQYLVKWSGYPDSFNSYVDEADILDNYKN